MIPPATTARILAEAMPYIRAWHGKVVVVRFGGAAMTDPALKAAFARDVALLQLVGMKPVVVHGGGWRVDELMLQMGVEPRRVRGRRVTDAATLNLVEMALDELNQELTGLVNQQGGRAVGLNGQDGRFIRARRLPFEVLPTGERVDLGFVGDVASIDVELIELLLSRQFVPVILPIGVGDDGTAYHINSDLLAGALARALARGEARADDQRRRRARRERQARLHPHRQRGRRHWWRAASSPRTCCRASRRRSTRCARACARCTSSTAPRRAR